MERLRVLTLNIWNRQGPWAERLPLIRAGLVEHMPDVVGFQEVLAFGGTCQADEIAAGLGYHVHYAPAWEIGGGLTMGNAILSRWPFADTQVLPMVAPPDTDTRCVAFARVDVPGGPVPVFVTHLTFQLHLSQWRCQQVRMLADHVKALAPVAGAPPVIMGDLNAEPDSDEMRFLRGLTPLGGDAVYFADAWLTTAGAEPGAGPGWTWDRRNTYALRAREPSRRIDYVLVRGPDRNLRGEPLAARVVFDQPVAGVWASDHFGVLADLQLGMRPADPY
jgi:endonuclease/exonuclease/phosphatase family metal-dependent hydrolase